MLDRNVGIKYNNIRLDYKNLLRDNRIKLNPFDQFQTISKNDEDGIPKSIYYGQVKKIKKRPHGGRPYGLGTLINKYQSIY